MRPKRYRDWCNGSGSTCEPSSIPKRRVRHNIDFLQRHVGILKKLAMPSTWFHFRFVRNEEIWEEYGRDVFMYHDGNEEAMTWPEGTSVSFRLFEHADGKPQAADVLLISK